MGIRLWKMGKKVILLCDSLSNQSLWVQADKSASACLLVKEGGREQGGREGEEGEEERPLDKSWE